jgi:hypothetical protein
MQMNFIYFEKINLPSGRIGVNGQEHNWQFLSHLVHLQNPCTESKTQGSWHMESSISHKALPSSKKRKMQSDPYKRGNLF